MVYILNRWYDQRMDLTTPFTPCILTHLMFDCNIVIYSTAVLFFSLQTLVIGPQVMLYRRQLIYPFTLKGSYRCQYIRSSILWRTEGRFRVRQILTPKYVSVNVALMTQGLRSTNGVVNVFVTEVHVLK